jgi:hypothetical protein
MSFRVQELDQQELDAARRAKAEQQRDADLRHALSTVEGRRFFWRLLEQAGLYSPSYAEKAEATAYNEGRRSIAIALLQEAQRVAPERYLQALREQQDAVAQETRERAKEQLER